MSKQLVSWDFTWKLTKKDGTKWDYNTIGTGLTQLCKKFVFQFEKGEQNGYEHIQGRMSLIKATIKKTLLDQFLKIFKVDESEAPNYLEPTTTGIHETKRNFNYVMKDTTRIEGPWTDDDFIGKEILYIPIQFRGLMDRLYPYQKLIMDYKVPQYDRVINYIYSPKGNEGKSTIVGLMEVYDKGGIDVPSFVDSAEKIVNYVADICIDGKIQTGVSLFIDMPRALNKDKLGNLYAAIEHLKKGLFGEMRYKTRRCRIDTPAIWVFANQLPDLTLLSLDRWKIWVINDKKELVPFDWDEYFKQEQEEFLKKQEERNQRRKMWDDERNNDHYIKLPLRKMV